MHVSQTKEEIAYSHLKKLIASPQFNPGDLLPTEMEISRELGINRITIAKALSSLKNEGFVARRAGRGTTLLRKPASSSANLIMVISPWPSWDIRNEWYFSRLLYSIQTEAIRNGMATINLAVHAETVEEEDFAKIRDIYNAVECRGAIVADPYIATQHHLQTFLRQLDCRSVWAGATPHETNNAHIIDIDDYQASFDLTKKLIELKCRRPAYISFQINSVARAKRLQGYKDALAAMKIDLDERYIIWNGFPASLIDAGSECAGIYAARGLDADSFILSDLLMFEGIRKFCTEIQTPQLKKLIKLPVATFDFRGNTSYPNIKFTSVQPIEQVGKEAVEMLVSYSEEKQIRLIPAEILSF